MRKLKIISLLIILTASVSCSKLKEVSEKFSNSDGTKKGVAVNVPRNLKNAFPDWSINKETSFVVTLPNNNDIFVGADIQPIDKTTLGERIKQYSGRVPNLYERAVYIKADSTIDYKTLVTVLDQLRRNDINKVNLVVSQTDKPDAIAVLEVKIPDLPKPTATVEKPNPLTLIVTMAKDGKLKLNQEDNTPDSLKARLREVFRNREENGVFREGTNEVEKTIFVKAPLSIQYGEVAKIIDALIEAGASPIGLQLDDLSD